MHVQKVYDFIWDEFCDWYIETCKICESTTQTRIRRVANAALWTLKTVLGRCTEASSSIHAICYRGNLQQTGSRRRVTDDVQAGRYMRKNGTYAENENILNHYKEIVRGVRNVRSEMNVPNSRKATIYVVCEDEKLAKGLAVLKESAMMMASAGDFIVQADKSGIADDAVSVVVPDATVYVPLEELIDFEQEKERLTKEETRLNKEIARSNGMLNNEKFVSKAPAAKVQEEREKLEKYEQMLAQVKERLAGLQKK